MPRPPSTLQHFSLIAQSSSAVARGGGGVWGGWAQLELTDALLDHVRLILLYYLRVCAKKCFVSFSTRSLISLYLSGRISTRRSLSITV